MTDASPKPIRASREIIWHLTCGQCGYYWSYPTMDAAEGLGGKTLHCPLCGTGAAVDVQPDPGARGGNGD